MSSFYLQANEHTEGYGWKIPHTPIHLGGYLSAKYDQEESQLFQFDDVALLFYGSFERFHLLGEVEYSDLSFSKSQEAEDDHINKKGIHIERLQLDYAVGDNSSFRIGKFNSDIGYWNQTPVNVLDDTTTAPNILRHLFPKLSTGVSYHQDFDEGEKSFSLTFQHNHDLDKDYNNILIDRHYALNYHSLQELFSWNFSSGYFREIDKVSAYYIGIGAEKETDTWTLVGELFSKKQQEKSIPYDAYLQATWHIRYGHDIVFREEAYKDNSIDVSEQISLLGYTYRPWTSVALKGEYIYHTALPKNRFVLSFSVIF